MRNRARSLAFWLLLTAVTLACRGLVRVPDVSAPAALPTVAPGSLRPAAVPRLGLTFALPDSWELRVAPSGVAMTSSAEDVDDGAGAVMTLQSAALADVLPPDDQERDTALDILRRELTRWAFFTRRSVFRLRQEATAVQINGQEGAVALIHLQSDRYPPRQMPELGGATETALQPQPDDYWLSVRLAVIRDERQVVTILAVTPVTLEERFAPQFDAIIESLEVGEPAPAMEDG